MDIVSSHEHEVVKVSYWYQSMSVVVVRRQQFALTDKSSYTTWPTITKFHWNVPYMTHYKIIYLMEIWSVKNRGQNWKHFGRNGH